MTHLNKAVIVLWENFVFSGLL